MAFVITDESAPPRFTIEDESIWPKTKAAIEALKTTPAFEKPGYPTGGEVAGLGMRALAVPLTAATEAAGKVVKRFVIEPTSMPAEKEASTMKETRERMIERQLRAGVPLEIAAASPYLPGATTPKAVEEMRTTSAEIAGSEALGYTPVGGIVKTVSRAGKIISAAKVPEVLAKTTAVATKIPSKVPAKAPSTIPGERGFAESVRRKTESAEIQKRLADEPITYEPLANKVVVRRVDKALEVDPVAARARVFNEEGALDADTSVIGLRLMQSAEKAGDYDEVIRITTRVAERATTSGQGIQALSLFGRLSPEGIARYAGRIAAMAEKEGKNVGLTGEKMKSFMDRSAELEKLPEGRDKLLKTAVLYRDIHETVPPSLGRKLATMQTMAQLLSPKTYIRNIIGNTAQNALENVARLTATGADILTSKVTGVRTVTTPSLGAQRAGFKRGLKEGTEEAKLGVSVVDMPRFEIDRRSRTFRTGPLAGAEKLMRIELQAADRAFYQAAFDESVLNQARVAAINAGKKGAAANDEIARLVANPSKEMIEEANRAGLYNTFQDQSELAKSFEGIKAAANFRREFGLGDMILKYPRTPANLLNRAAAYSPLGFFRGVSALPVFAKGGKFNQQVFVESLGRATVGTGGLTSTGYALSELGLLSEKPSTDPRAKELAAETGAGRYAVNISGLRRFITSGFDPAQAKRQSGDEMVSYDWLQPAAVPIQMGAEIARAGKTLSAKDERVSDKIMKATFAAAPEAAEAAALAMNTLAEQPLLTGIKRFFRESYGEVGVPYGILQTMSDIPASFVPSALAQLNAAIDNTKRDTRDPNLFKEAINGVAAKIPMWSATLPAKQKILGTGEQERYAGGRNNAFNVFLNPAFVTEYLPEPEAKVIMDIHESTGETGHLPRFAPATIRIAGLQYDLKPDEIGKYQNFMAERTQDEFKMLARNYKTGRNDIQIAGDMEAALRRINNATKDMIIKDHPQIRRALQKRGPLKETSQ